jgi:Tetratricopeptide repeat
VITAGAHGFHVSDSWSGLGADLVSKPDRHRRSDACVSPRAAMIPAGRLLLHVVEATSHARELGTASGSCVRLLNAVAGALVNSGQLDNCRPLLKRSLAIAHTQRGPDHPDTLITRNNLASMLGRSDASSPHRVPCTLFMVQFALSLARLRVFWWL